MKVSELTVADLKEYAREYTDDTETNRQFEQNLAVAKAFIKSYTGLTTAQIDEHDEFVAVVKVLSNEMYDNRAYTVEVEKINPFVKSILDMHSVNLL